MAEGENDLQLFLSILRTVVLFSTKSVQVISVVAADAGDGANPTSVVARSTPEKRNEMIFRIP